MKIIGISSVINGNDTRLVHVTTDELAQLNGLHNAYAAERGSNGNSKSFDVGQTIEVSRLYTDATFLISLYNELRADVAANQKRLNKLADLLNPPAKPAKE